MLAGSNRFTFSRAREVVLINLGDTQVRHVYMNVPHLANPKLSWYGDSVGHYEGDELVVDTVGFNDKTFVDGHLNNKLEAATADNMLSFVL
jgi:hypothetical protein